MNEVKGAFKNSPNPRAYGNREEFFSLKEPAVVGVRTKERANSNQSLRAIKNQKLMEVSRLYEKHFLRELVKAMRKTVPESQLTAPSLSEKIYKQKLDQEYVEKWGDAGGIGLSSVIYENLKNQLNSE